MIITPVESKDTSEHAAVNVLRLSVRGVFGGSDGVKYGANLLLSAGAVDLKPHCTREWNIDPGSDEQRRS